MKKYFKAILLLLLILFTGCFEWEYDNCVVRDNCTLRFLLHDADGNDLFAGKIETIDVIIFDSDNSFVTHRKVKYEELEEGNCVRFTLDPREYRVVAWGNVLENNSTLSPLDTGIKLEDSYVEIISKETGSPLYYAPGKTERTFSTAQTEIDYADYTVNIELGKKTEKDLPFVRAHRTINVYIKGLSNLTNYDGQQPLVEFSSLPYRYNFLQNCAPERNNFSRQADYVQVDGLGNVYTTSVTAPITGFEDAMQINILNKSNNEKLLGSLNLKQWVEENVPEDINEFDILIRVGVDASITITLPNWDEIGVKPGLPE